MAAKDEPCPACDGSGQGVGPWGTCLLCNGTGKK